MNLLVAVTQNGQEARHRAQVLQAIIAIFKESCCVTGARSRRPSVSVPMKPSSTQPVLAKVKFWGLAELFIHHKVSVRFETDSDCARRILQRRGPACLEHIEIRGLAIPQWTEKSVYR